MILEIISVLILFAPLIAELWDDRHGDQHPNHDWLWRTLMIGLCSGAVFLINHRLNFFQPVALSFGIFVLFFPYLMNIIHYRNGVISDKRWWNHLSKTAFPDKLEWWSNLEWYYRLFLVAVIFAATVMVYVCWPCIFQYQGR